MLAWRGDDPANADLPVAARRPRAAVRQGLDRHRLADPDARSSASSADDITQVLLAGSFGSLPVAGQRRPDRPGAEAGAAAHRLGRQRGRRGREDGGAVAARARRGRRHPGRGASTSSCPGGQTSTTCSSTSWRSRDDRPPSSPAGRSPCTSTAIAERRGWRSTCTRCRPSCTTGPERIAPAVAELVERAGGRYDRVAVAYADCGSYGALDRELDGAASPGWRASTATTCSRATRWRQAMAEQPGTYFLTDFLARTFERTVVALARPRPPPRAARRLLPRLHARRSGSRSGARPSCRQPAERAAGHAGAAARGARGGRGGAGARSSSGSWRA